MPVLLTSDEQAEAWLAVEPLSAKVFNTICTPYNGDNLVWHPVTPSMSHLSYQLPDASQNVEQKRGNIASFFKAGAKAKTAKASGSTSAPQASTQAEQKIAADVTDAHHARLDASSASELATGAPDYPGKHDQHQDGDCGHGASSQPSDRHELAGGHTEPEGKLEGNHVVKEEPTEGDVLNTDDAGGIVAKSEQGSAPLNSPSSAKRSAPPAKSPISKKARTGTIDSFFGRKT
ncbi:hypothetical protein ABBQ38_014100 [Trebouxia sp. C0009 RCD-2024]